MTTKTKTATNATTSVRHEAVINNETRVFRELSVGESPAQGDLYFVNIGTLPTSAKSRTSRQLADGATMGSRHVVERGDVFDCDAAECVAAIRAANGCDIAPQYIGPVFRCPAYIDHPEHGHHDYQCEGVMVTVYQRTQDAEEREERVRD